MITDLRLLGVAFKDKSIADVVNGLRWWKRVGFIIMFSMGFTLFGSKAADYYPNPYFWIKMSFLVLVLIHAIIFRPTVYNHPEELDESPVIPTRAKVAGALSLIIWTAVLCNGRLIGYYEPPAKRATSFQSARTISNAFSQESRSSSAGTTNVCDLLGRRQGPEARMNTDAKIPISAFTSRRATRSEVRSSWHPDENNSIRGH